MKRLITLFLVIFMISGLTAQNKSDLPDITLKTIDGTSINISRIYNDGKPFIFAFWASWCPNDIKQFDTWNKLYDEWTEETGVKIYAISIDDYRYKQKMKELVEQKQWPFVFICDENKTLGKAMNVINVPHVFLFDGDGKIVYEHKGFLLDHGYEYDLYNEILKIIK